MVEEVLLSCRENSKRLKNLSTTLSYKVEAKGKDRFNEELLHFVVYIIFQATQIFTFEYKLARDLPSSC